MMITPNSCTPLISTRTLYPIMQHLAALRGASSSESFTDETARSWEILLSALNKLPPGILSENLSMPATARLFQEQRDTFTRDVEKSLLLRPDWYSFHSTEARALGSRLTHVKTSLPIVENHTVDVSAPDPDGITLAGYRLAEASVLAAALTPSSPYKIVMLSAFYNVGLDYILPDVVKRLESQGITVFRFSCSDPKSGPGLIRTAARQDTTPPVILIEDAQEIEPRRFSNLQQGLMRYFQRMGEQAQSGTVLICGTTRLHSPRENLFFLEDAIGHNPLFPFAEPSTRLNVCVEPKPLNHRQTAELLTADVKVLATQDRLSYAAAVIEQVPPYLDELHPYRLPSEMTGLESALAFLAERLGGKKKPDIPHLPLGAPPEGSPADLRT